MILLKTSVYELPFKPGDNIIELGGGETPLKHSDSLKTFNVDSRPLPSVDLVRDLEKDFSDVGQFEGLYASYIAEHIGWRKNPQFFKSCLNILKPGGIAVFVVPNLLAQAQIIAEKGEELNSTEVCMIFGDQNYDENAHASGWSPSFIEKLLHQAGFGKVIGYEHPNWRGDMIIEAYKKAEVPSNQTLEEKYDRTYFEDGTKGYFFYRDFPAMWKFAKLITDRGSKNVLDVGGGRGYLTKKLLSLGIDSWCMDGSLHCWHTRATKNFTLHDATKAPWPFKDKQFDLCFSTAFLEHIDEKDLPIVLREMERVSKNGFHTTVFHHDPNDIDVTHVMIKPYEWWINLFKTTIPNYPVELLTDEQVKHLLEVAPVPLPESDGLTKVNFGSFTCMFHDWLNVDIEPLQDFAQKNGYLFRQHDVRQPIPLKDNSVDFITAHHLIEHLTREEGKIFFKECLRILKPKGTIRFSTPNIHQLATEYLEIYPKYRWLNVGVEKQADTADGFYRLLAESHKTFYDAKGLSNILTSIGFTNVCETDFDGSHCEVIRKQTVDSFPTLSFYLEAEKPLNTQLNTSDQLNEQVASIIVKPDAKIDSYNGQLQPYQKYLRGELKEGTQ